MTSSYDEMPTAKALLDQRAITPEGFDAKRARLLAGDEPDDDEAPMPAPPPKRLRGTRFAPTALIVFVVASFVIAAAIIAAAFPPSC